ncbi:AAA family ATPase [Herminiimonas fonticola]|uniref:ATPase family protein associated with various cellular activities (AAA) n=1 Tax=Herminiimonas fonticola TaxID=303380 RepID=A0A4R6GID7_9BURK|nr:AAA family ATPase [Herminiimonas fonticola]RBA25660.1 ATPase family associated with various cellular activities (AAA) [Herminiimonas fonticola]TDN94769.1 ATPase family protein associated with various cellular activities (AAA) [Herminiimonas fonticola]
MSDQNPSLFERTTNFPDPDANRRLQRLIGMEDKIKRLANMLGVLVNPQGLNDWLKKHHSEATSLLDTVMRRPPLIILNGDVGSGKTELAETIGDLVARQEKIEIELLPLSLSSRGQGRVGEMTQLVSAAFETAYDKAAKLKSSNGGRARGGVILLVDEADALAQSREESQMHHEDRAGVNAFIRGIDKLANGRVPAAVIMCTNRLNALDPAVRRRAADILDFARPTDEQRHHVFERWLSDAGFKKAELAQLTEATGNNGNGRHGFTYSDLTQRLLPSIVLDAYPAGPIKAARAIEIARSMLPTPPFKDA